MQSGQLFKRNGAWHIRFYQDEIVDGVAVRRRVAKRLAAVDDNHRTKKDLQELIALAMGPANANLPAESSLSFGDFYQKYFLRHVEQQATSGKRKMSTLKFYKDAYRYHLEKSIGTIRLRDFRTVHAQSVLDSLDTAGLKHQSILRIKTAMSAAFTIARQKGFYHASNPIQDTKAEGIRKKFHGHAYTMADVKAMLARLPEPAKTLVAVAAYTGLRESELRGLRWPDYNGTLLHVNRAVWRTHVEQPKTEDSENFVPVIAPLRAILDAHKLRCEKHDGFMFAGPKKGFALNTANIVKREIRPLIGDAWHGWHSFRRGLATNLFELGVKSEVAQLILRHTDAETTRRHYIMLTGQQHGQAAMKKLERAIQGPKSGQQMGNSRNRVKSKKRAKHA